MADHLNLLPAITMDSKRVNINYDPDPPVFDTRVHATTLRGILEGLNSHGRPLFPSVASSGNSDEATDIDADDLGEIVLKITGRTQFASDAFSKWDLQPLAVNSSKQYYALSNTAARRAFADLASAYDQDPENYTDVKAWATVLENIENIELYGPSDRLAPGVTRPGPDETVVIDVILWPTSIARRGDQQIGQERVQTLRDLIAEFDSPTEVLAADDTHPDTLLLHVRVDQDAFGALLEHSYVQTIRGPLAVEVRASDLDRRIGPRDTVLPEGAKIGIIDDLVTDDNPWLEGVIAKHIDITPEGITFGTPTRHGTQVAGLAAWGDNRALLDPDFDGQPHPLYVARVAQANSRFEAQIVGSAKEQISTALDWMAENDVKIVVIAFGYPYPDSEAMPSELSAEIDSKAKEHDMVIVTPAGNVIHPRGDEWKLAYPDYLGHDEAKISAPGTAALALTVGSIAHTEAVDDEQNPYRIRISPVGQPAPFSRTGPVAGFNRSGRQKPEFAARGGSWAWDDSTSTPVVDDPTMAAITLIPPTNGRLFAAAAGTSYAAPLVAHEVATIATRYPDAGANLLRALTALSGRRPPKDYQDLGPLAHMYGIPDASKVLESGGNRVIVTYEGSIATNSHTVLEIPVPPEFATVGQFDREVRVALAFDPPVRRSRRDYIAGRMEFDLQHRSTLDEIRAAYAKQPELKERQADPTKRLINKPSGKDLRPPKTRLTADTLIARTFHTPTGATWSEDDGPYFLVVTHEHSPWSPSQKNAYEAQSFAVAIELIDRTRTDLDLYNQVELTLRARARARGLQP